MGKKLFISLLCLFASMGIMFAQTVSGTITDANTGEPIPAASVVIKGTLTGVVAGTDGQYLIDLGSAENPVLVYRSVGYKEQEIPVNGRSVIDVTLQEDTQMLQDVVVVAYGTQKREAITGSVSDISGDQLAGAPVTSVDKMLSGKLAGVSISATSGQPGSTTQIRIRGNGSINASNAPLWVVDGIPIISGDISQFSNQSSSLTNINPNDIESITVLKDAAAAAAYGSRAANGVILVTTKSGREGKSQISAYAKWGVNWLESDSDFRMMDAEELLTFQRDAITNAGMDPDDPNGTYYRPLSLLDGNIYDVLDEFTRLGNLQEYQISATGGNKKAKYFSSFLYQKNKGIAYGIDYTKFQSRLNASYKILRNLETGVRINAGYYIENDVPMQSLYYSNPIFAGMTIMPWTELKNDDGTWNVDIPSNSNTNPRATAEYDDQWDKGYTFNGTANLKWEPIKDLVLETKESAELKFIRGRRYWSPKSGNNEATLQVSNYTIRQFTTSNTATYSHMFGDHSLRVVAGQEAMRFHSDYLFTYAPGVDESIPYVQTAPQSNTQSEQGISRETMLSFFGIADYNYDNRYFLQANFREDGSSLFGENKKWGAFWSVSGSWNLTNEKFLQDYTDILSLFKIRVSYGVNGNNGIDPYQAYGVYSSTSYNNNTGYRPSQLANDELSWEKNYTFDVGFDFSLFNNRLSGSFDYYNRETKDLLLDKQIPQTSGFSTIFTNVGSMRNRGVEFQLDGEIIHTNDILWTAGVNVAFNRTKILDLAMETSGEDAFLGTWRRTVEGKSMYTYYLYDYYGVNPSNGDALWVTSDGSLTNDFSKARRHYCGSPEPKATGGFNTVFSWKGLSLSAYFDFKAGNKVLLLNENRYLNSDGNQMNMNQMAKASNYWKQPGDVGVNPKPIAGRSDNSYTAQSDRWVEDGSYVRLKDVTLSYTLPKTWTEKIHLGTVRFYVSGLNLYCFNDVYYWDPEQGVTGTTAGQYPLTKSVVGGIELSF